MRQCNRLIYALTDPRSGDIRYVGRSSSGLTRPQQHLAPAGLAADTGHKANWIRELVRLGFKPGIVVLEHLADDCTEDALIAAEIRWIANYKPQGRLTNMTDGGEGAGFGNRNGVGQTHRQGRVQPRDEVERRRIT